ncbi:decaprenyl-phosphate phosphoribosyltransferase [Vibrio mexicanus]|uniref:decaprenyl-phosphate phosphoribosyltransferase n=1 Tax=Vibrio mexicanus TaxID=1004326 RepID=UPI00063C848A|nr:phosphoribose diphosphate--decaprenyl-phosphate phosphoribosyltransferase [Vibrio mexicanus]
MEKIKSCLLLMRPKQWIKNVFLFAPLVFSGQFLYVESFIIAVCAFLLFCVASSATYILNDYVDIENDRKHPVKSKSRPLASGDLSKTEALCLISTLYTILIASYFVMPDVILVILVYLGLNVAYTFHLKHQPVIDIFIIAFGFVLRVYAGSVAILVPLSSWMFITTLSLALYLAAIKRKQELMISGTNARSVLRYYNSELVDKYAEMSATCALLFYSLFVISDKPDLVLSIPFVIFGLYRYWFVVESKGGGESPTDALFSDVQLQAVILGWIVFCGYMLIY